MGRRQRKAQRSETQQTPLLPKPSWVTRPRALVAAFVVTISAGIAAVLALPPRKILLVIAITALVVVIVVPGPALWNRLRQIRPSKIHVLAIVLFIALALVIGPLVWTRVIRDGPTAKREATSKPSSKALVLVADFGAPDPRSAGAYRVSEIIQEKLQVAFSPYRDVRVVPLGRLLTAQDGSSTARAEGRKRVATIVIWGWYGKSSTTVVLSVHFELIAPLPHYAMPTLGPYTKGQIRKEPLHKLESFAIQEELSSELIYLSETSVGLSRLIAEDYDGAISHLTGALNAKGSRSSAEVRANRGIAYLSGPVRKFVRGYGPAGGRLSCQALGSLRYRPQAQSRASWGVPAGRPLGRTESW
jgi:hypothetical protein